MSDSTSRTAPTRGTTRRSDHPGPPLAAPMAVSALAWLAGAVLVPLLAVRNTMPDPTATSSSVAAYFDSASTPNAWSAALFVLAGSMLVAGGALMASRLAFLAPNAPGPALAGCGAVAAGVCLSLDGALLWATTLPAVHAEPALVTALHAFEFGVGGVCELSALGISVLGLSVTTLYVARTPRVLSVLGVVIAVVDLLTILTVPIHELSPLLPVARLASLVWLVVVCSLVPRNRAARGPRTSAVAETTAVGSS